GVLSIAQVTEVEEVLGALPPRAAGSHSPQARYAVRIDGDAATQVELRPAFCADIGRRESPITRLRSTRSPGGVATLRAGAEPKVAPPRAWASRQTLGDARCRGAPRPHRYLLGLSSRLANPCNDRPCKQLGTLRSHLE